jgi:hypothetical protein
VHKYSGIEVCSSDCELDLKKHMGYSANSETVRAERMEKLPVFANMLITRPHITTVWMEERRGFKMADSMLPLARHASGFYDRKI